MRNEGFLLLYNLKYIICGHIRTFLVLFIIFWTIYFITFASKLYRFLCVFQWVLISFIELQIYLCLAMRETLCCLFLILIKQALLKHLTLSQAIKVTFLILIILISNKWRVRYIPLRFSKLNKANSFDTEAQILDLDLSVTNGIASSKIYDK